MRIATQRTCGLTHAWIIAPIARAPLFLSLAPLFRFGETALHITALKQDLTIVKALVDAGGDINAVSDGTYPGHDVKVRRSVLMWYAHRTLRAPTVHRTVTAQHVCCAVHSRKALCTPCCVQYWCSACVHAIYYARDRVTARTLSLPPFSTRCSGIALFFLHIHGAVASD